MRARLDRFLSSIELQEPGTPPRRRDWILMSIFGIAAVAELVLYELFDQTEPWPWFRLVVSALVIGLFPWRRVVPLQAALVAFFAETGLEIAGGTQDVEVFTTFGMLLAAIALVYALCRWLKSTLAAAGFAAILSLALIGGLADGGSVLEDFLSLIPWLVVGSFALAMRFRATLIRQQHSQVRLAERNTLARELHDTVAHHVSAIAVQAQAAQFIAKTDPAAAVTAMKAVEDTANRTIDEMRQMVGILRSESDQARGVSPTTLVDLADPNGSPRVATLGITDLSLFPTAVAAAIYRIAQESITNARRHSRDATFVDVTVTTIHDSVELEVINDGTPTSRNSGSGFGQIEMRERVDALGGTFASGPRPASGWRIHAAIPLKVTS